MRSPAAAFAWEFRRRHRWGWLVLGGYLLALGTVKHLIFGPGPVDHDDARFAGFVVVPLTATFMYLLSVFCFGFAGNLAAPQSLYPTRLFALPVTTAALAGWPMLFGTAAMATLWLVTRIVAVWPSGVHVPLVWPAVLAAALLAWTQALTWMPYALAGLRVIVMVLWLAIIDTAVLLALHFKPSEAVMLALLAPHLPLAYLVACVAVARARRGDAPSWRWVQARRAATVPSRPFASPARAQSWFEWRQHGRSLPTWVAILVPLELALLFISGRSPTTVLWVIAGALLTPPFLAVFVAATVRRSSPGSDSYGVPPFTATRPLSSASLIVAKLKVTMWSTLAAWLIVAIAVPLGLELSGTGSLVRASARHVALLMGTPRAVAIALLGLAVLLASTWKQLVQSLYLGMSGRAWLVKGSAFLALALVAGGVPLVYWIADDRAAIAALWDALPWIAAVLVGIKLSAAAWIAVRLRARRLLGDRALVLGAAAWAGLVLALDGLLAWIFPALLVRRDLCTLVAILLVPLARLSAAPLALAWNRHRGVDRVSRAPGRVIALVLALLGLPAGVAALQAVSFAVRNRNNGSIVSSGETREYLLHVPARHDRSRPTPLVISMHGAGGWPAQQQDTSQWNRLADEQGFIVVYPSGLEGAGPRIWHVERDPRLQRDVRFIADLLDALESSYNIDPTRVYANGLSNGGGMTFVLSCTMSDRIAAFGMVAAAQTLPSSWCGDPRPVPMIAFHGTADPIVPYRGGPSPVAPESFPAVESWVASWARRNRCGPWPVESAVAADVARVDYAGCADDAAVTLYRIEGGGHTWPGGEPLPEWLLGSTSNGVDATSRMWAFFLAHPLRPAR